MKISSAQDNTLIFHLSSLIATEQVLPASLVIPMDRASGKVLFKNFSRNVTG
jgi:hypothetical protein